jgi:hypothetical protein
MGIWFEILEGIKYFWYTYVEPMSDWSPCVDDRSGLLDTLIGLPWRWEIRLTRSSKLERFRKDTCHAAVERYLPIWQLISITFKLFILIFQDSEFGLFIYWWYTTCRVISWMYIKRLFFSITFTLYIEHFTCTYYSNFYYAPLQSVLMAGSLSWVERRGRMVRTSDSQPAGRGFESRRRHGVVSMSRIP